MSLLENGPAMEMAMTDQNQNHTTSQTSTNNDTSSTASLTIRMIMQGKEAGSIIGKKGDNVKKFREESGAKINISDSSCPERIVTITGSTDQIFKAFTMICKKFEEDILNSTQNSALPKPPVTIRLIVPASQCGSLIGKGGSKIKEIREITGASIQVASEMLPNSTERAVTMSGSADAITQSIYHICCVMLESPPKGATIPYRPKPAMPPVIFAAGGQAFTVQGQYAIPQPDITKMAMHQGLCQPGMPMMGAQPGLMPGAMGMPGGVPHQHQHQQPGFPRPNAPTPNNAQSHEMTIPNDLIGCIIGRGGAKINEIRQLSGAQIKIANSDEGSSDRKVTITGTPETINAAQYLINASLELHKSMTLDPNMNLNPVTSTMSSTLTSSPPPLVPLNQLMKPVPLLAAAGHHHHHLPNITNMAFFDTFAANRKAYAPKIKGGAAVLQAVAGSQKNGSSKFAPY